MTDRSWSARTRSGATYTHEAGRSGVLVDSPNSGREYYHNPTLYSFKLADHPAGPVDFAWLRTQPQVDVPVVGEHLYTSTIGDSGWRISTEIVEVSFD